MIGRNVIVFGFIALALIVSGCETPSDEKIENVIRVFMHEPNKFSFMIQTQESSEIRMITLEGKAEFIADALETEKMWVIARGRQVHYGGYVSVNRLEIHIHSPKDINGAGWDHGKFGSGQTQVIE